MTPKWIRRSSATALIGFLEEVPLDEELCIKTLQIAIFAAKLRFCLGQAHSSLHFPEETNISSVREGWRLHSV
jgi:hypothetical protein